MSSPRLYSDLAAWWPLLSPPAEYEEEAEDLLPLLRAGSDQGEMTLLELGSGGGSLACHLKRAFRMTVTDISPEMLATNSAVNPECEVRVGDMRTLDMGREFDRVLIHDAIMYATSPADLRATIANAARHCRPGGAAVFVPDCVRETFEPSTAHGGHDGPDGRGLRYLEWSWDPDPADCTFQSVFAFLLRDAAGNVRTEMDPHTVGLFSRSEWLGWLDEAGFEARIHRDPWERDVFIGRRRGE